MTASGGNFVSAFLNRNKRSAQWAVAPIENAELSAKQKRLEFVSAKRVASALQARAATIERTFARQFLAIDEAKPTSEFRICCVRNTGASRVRNANERSDSPVGSAEGKRLEFVSAKRVQTPLQGVCTTIERTDVGSSPTVTTTNLAG